MRREDAAARLLAALRDGDELALTGVLDPVARLVVDTGDATGGEVHGRASVIRSLLARLASRADAVLEPVRANGAPGIALRHADGVVLAVLGVDADPGGTITRLWLSAAPAKLRHWNRPRPSRD